jgi:hypothetical protein
VSLIGTFLVGALLIAFASSPLHRGENLDLGSIREDARLPPGPGDDFAVHGHGNAAGVRGDLETAKDARNCLARAQLGLFSVEANHESPPETAEARSG